MTEFNDGDTIRVEFEGYASKDSLGRVLVDGDMLPVRRAKTVTVVKKRQPQVGDVLTGPEWVAWSAPVGSVVKFLPRDHAFWFRGHDGWRSRFGDELVDPAAWREFRVEYVPQVEL